MAVAARVAFSASWVEPSLEVHAISTREAMVGGQRVARADLDGVLRAVRMRHERTGKPIDALVVVISYADAMHDTPAIAELPLAKLVSDAGFVRLSQRGRIHLY